MSPYYTVNRDEFEAALKRSVLSRRDLSDEAGVNRSTILRMEQGHRVQPRTIRRIADVLGVPPGRLVK